MANDIIIIPASASVYFSGSNSASISLRAESNGIVSFIGRSGSLFSIEDTLSGSLMSVSDISGLPIFEVFSDDSIKMGKFNAEALVVPPGGQDVRLGSGSVLFISSSKQSFLSGSITASNFVGTLTGTSSYSVTSSWAVNAINGGTQLDTGSTYPITASWAESASLYTVVTQSTYEVTMSWASSSFSSSYSETASYAANAGGTPIPDSVTSSFYEFPVQSAKMAATKSAELNSGVVCWELFFWQNQSAIWQMRVPEGYSGSLKNRIQWYATGSATGDQQVMWNVYLTTVTPGTSTVVTASSPNFEALGISASFQQSASWLQETTIWLTGSPVTASDLLIYKLERGTGSADTAVGPIALVNTTFEWVKG